VKNFERLQIHFALALLLFFGFDSLIHSEKPVSAQKRYQFESPQMGVPFRLVIYTDRGASHASVAAGKVWGRISFLNNILSNYETDSELSRLGYGAGQGIWTHVSDELWTVITHAQRLSVSSQGAFDFTLGPATALWRKVRRQKQLPSPQVLNSMMRRTGWHHLVLSPEDLSVCLTVPGMRLDPGGIAKGFALDEGLKVLGPMGISSALISGGGDMAVLDAPPNASGWQVRLADFKSQIHEAGIIELNNRAIATSGDLFQFVDIEGKRYSHILHPKTGLGLTQRVLVSVIAPTGMEADSLATTLSVLGPEKSPGWIDQHDPLIQVRMLWIDDHEHLHQWQTESFGDCP